MVFLFGPKRSISQQGLLFVLGVAAASIAVYLGIQRELNSSSMVGFWKALSTLSETFQYPTSATNMTKTDGRTPIYFLSHGG
jgi:hypothetical protein